MQIPQKIQPNTRLVLVFHGYTGSAKGVMRFTQHNEIADRDGFIVAYPQGSIDLRGENFFNVGHDFNTDSLVDDLDYTRQLILKLHRDNALSASKTLATGFSTGDDMSDLLVCTSSDVIRAVAPVAGVLMKPIKDRCLHEKPLPIFAMYGTDDDISLYSADMQNRDGFGAYLDLPATAQFLFRCTV
ncbi:MAG: alpha/beta hydrolase family esterase [Cellvibrionales bacterium]